MSAKGERSAPAIERIGQLAVNATDLNATVAFYRDVLQLPLLAEIDPPGAGLFPMWRGAPYAQRAHFARAATPELHHLLPGSGSGFFFRHVEGGQCKN